MANSMKFGKSAEYFVASLMLRENLSVYFPLADDHGVDAIVEKPNGNLAKVQIKARSKNVKNPNDVAWFSGIKHDKQENFWLVFYSEKMQTIWMLSSAEFVEEQSRKGSDIYFHQQVEGEVVVGKRFEKYIIYPPRHGRKSFQRLLDE